MSISEKFHFEELDEHTRHYLLKVRDQRGKGMPGVYVSKSDNLPALGCFFGLAVLIGFGILAANVITEAPLAVAMLETTGLLLGGWLIVAAVRVWASAKQSSYAGHFIYADAETLWDCAGYYVNVTDLGNIVEARGVQNFNEGNYQNTAITVTTSDGGCKLTVKDMERGRRLIVFLNMIAWMRSGGEEATVQDVNLKSLSAPVMGGVAKVLAKTGEMPRGFSVDDLGLDVDEVPLPKKDGHPSSSVLSYLLIVAFAVVSVLIFQELNIGWRDDAIWDHITTLRTEDRRVPFLRGYLADARNTHHRDDAKKMLVKIYENNIARMKNPVGVAAPLNPMAINNPVVKVNDDLVNGFAEVLRAIAEQPQGIISVSVKESDAAGNPAEAKKREDEVRSKFTLKLFEGIGKELAFFVTPPDDVPGLIDISYKLVRKPGGLGNNYDVTFTVKFRKKPDDEPVKRVTVVISASSNSPAEIARAAEELGLRTAGIKKPEPPPEF